MDAVILAAGKSTRTHPLTVTRPKPLLPILNRPILSYHLDALQGLVDAVVLVIGYRGDMIRDHYGSSYEGMALRYVKQPEPRGTGDAILAVLRGV